MGADVVQELPPLDRDALDRNLEENRAQGLACPHCHKVNEWTLGPKTKTDILDTLLRPGVDGIHEKLIRCEDGACLPFLRRITAGHEGSLKVETISLDNMLVDLRYARALAQVADQHARDVEAIRHDLQRQLEAVRAETGQGKGAAEKTAQLERDAADLDSWLRTAFSKLGFADTDDRVGFIEKLDEILAAAQILADMARLGNTTPAELLKKAEAFAVKHGRR